jgi:hypothetical protein
MRLPVASIIVRKLCMLPEEKKASLTVGWSTPSTSKKITGMDGMWYAAGEAANTNPHCSNQFSARASTTRGGLTPLQRVFCNVFT